MLQTKENFEKADNAINIILANLNTREGTSKIYEDILAENDLIFTAWEIDIVRGLINAEELVDMDVSNVNVNTPSGRWWLSEFGVYVLKKYGSYLVYKSAKRKLHAKEKRKKIINKWVPTDLKKLNTWFTLLCLGATTYIALKSNSDSTKIESIQRGVQSLQDESRKRDSIARISVLKKDTLKRP